MSGPDGPNRARPAPDAPPGKGGNTFIGTLLVRGLNAFSVGASYVGCKRNPMNASLRALYQLPYDLRALIPEHSLKLCVDQLNAPVGSSGDNCVRR